MDVPADPFPAWLDRLAQRHLARLTPTEVRRAIQSLSSGYVTRQRAKGVPSGAGSRAAFAIYFAPLHYLLLRHVIEELGATRGKLQGILDLGCGTGVAGVAWSHATAGRPRVVGLDTNAWALSEARATYRAFRVRGRTLRADLVQHELPGAGWGIVSAYSVNELTPDDRETLGRRLLQACRKGACLLIVEPIARRLTPWWAEWTEPFTGLGGRQDDWRVATELPQLLRDFDRSARLDHQELTARTLWVDGDSQDGDILLSHPK